MEALLGPERFEYVRHGTASLVAAVAVRGGKVIAQPIERNNSKSFCSFLDMIEATVDPSLEIHVILDNRSGNVSKETKAWFAAHPQWVVHYTPPHASWVKIELFVSTLQSHPQQLHLARGPHRKLLAFIGDYDQTAKPLAWPYPVNPLEVA